MRPVITCVEGLIGAGKSTLLRSVDSSPQLRVIQEPAASFESLGEHNPLAIMYSDKKEAITGQAYINCVLRQHWTKHLGACRDSTVQMLVSERTLYSTRIFSQNLRDVGALTDFQFDFLTYQMQQAIDSLKLPRVGADKMFFLDVPIELCLERVSKRGRVGEQTTCDHFYLSGLRDQMYRFVEDFRECRGEANVRVTQTTDLNALKIELLDFVYNVQQM